MEQANPFEPPQASIRPAPVLKRRRVSLVVGWIGLFILLVWSLYPWPILMLIGGLLALIGFFPIGDLRTTAADSASDEP